MKITQEKFDEMKAKALCAGICYEWRRYLEKSNNFDELVKVSEMEEAYVLYAYAVYAIKGRFEEGEEAISKNAETSYRYAVIALKGRFEEGEEAISKDSIYNRLYNDFLFTLSINRDNYVVADGKCYRYEAKQSPNTSHH